MKTIVFIASLVLFSNLVFADDLYSKAVTESRIGNFEKAEEYINTFVKKNPKNADGYNMKGLIKAYSQEYEEALNIINSALIKFPNNFDLTLSSARISSWQNDWEQASIKLDALADKYPDNVEVLNLKARTEMYKGNNLIAKRTFSKALEYAPKNIESLIGIGDAFRALGESDNADIYYLKALEIEPENLVAKNRMGEIETKVEPKWTILTEGSTSWFKDNRRDWYSGALEIKRQAPDNFIRAKAEWRNRFKQNNSLFIIGAGKKFKGNRWLTGEIGGSPEADFIEKYLLRVGASIPLYNFRENDFINTIVGLIDVSRKEYKNDRLDTLEIGGSVYLFNGKTWITSHYIQSDSKSKNGYIYGKKIRLDIRATDNLRLYTGLGSVPEVESGQAFDVNNAFLGINYAFDNTKIPDLNLTLNREKRTNNYKRYDLTLGLLFHF